MSKREMTDSLERPGCFKELKVVLVGPAKCGKTALVQRFVNNIFSESYIPTGFEKYSTKRKIYDYTVEFSLWDTSGSGSYDTVRPLAYQDAQIFILCFSVSDPDSLQLAVDKWLKEIRSHCPDTPIILCGCKSDVRRSHHHFNDHSFYSNQSLAITRERATLTCQEIDAVAYIETSSCYQSPGITEIFELAAKICLEINTNSFRNCKTSTKKRKTYSISSTSTIGGKSSTLNSSSGSGIIKCNNNYNSKSHLKSDLKKNAKNCLIM